MFPTTNLHFSSSPAKSTQNHSKIIQKSSVPDILNGWSLLLPFTYYPNICSLNDN